jgi:hypothetical protein
VHFDNITNFGKVQQQLPDDGPDGPKHVGEARDILTVCCNIISVIKCIRWSQEPILNFTLKLILKLLLNVSVYDHLQGAYI